METYTKLEFEREFSVPELKYHILYVLGGNDKHMKKLQYKDELVQYAYTVQNYGKRGKRKKKGPNTPSVHGNISDWPHLTPKQKHIDPKGSHHKNSDGNPLQCPPHTDQEKKEAFEIYNCKYEEDQRDKDKENVANVEKIDQKCINRYINAHKCLKDRLSVQKKWDQYVDPKIDNLENKEKNGDITIDERNKLDKRRGIKTKVTKDHQDVIDIIQEHMDNCYCKDKAKKQINKMPKKQLAL
tara:strand:- start:1024 stop:1746 length:723 start_codon:yes stop_codon:yes gene_type:complete